MARDRSSNVSKHRLDEAAFIFIRHPGQCYTRAEIQNILGVSKTTAHRILTELSERISLTETVEGQTSYFSLPDDAAAQIYQTLNLVLAVTDRERLALSFLLHGQGISDIFNDSITALGEKLKNAGLVSFQENIKEAHKNTQMIEEKSEYLVDTILHALETKTKIEVEYKGAFSDKVKTHLLYPVGMYLRDGNLYLYAYNPRFEDATSFAYSRIISIDVKHDEHYTIPENISMDAVINDPFGVALAPPRRVKVHIYNKQVFFEKEKKWPADAVFTDCPDGSLLIEMTIADPYAFRSWALSLGENCYVESPDELAEWVYRGHKEAAEFYKGRF